MAAPLGAQAGARPGSRRSGAGTERSEAAWGARNRSGWRGKAGATQVAALCSARTGGGRERKEEEEKAPGEEGIRSCTRDKADCGVEGEDRQAATRGGRRRRRVGVRHESREQNDSTKLSSILTIQNSKFHIETRKIPRMKVVQNLISSNFCFRQNFI